MKKTFTFTDHLSMAFLLYNKKYIYIFLEKSPPNYHTNT